LEPSPLEPADIVAIARALIDLNLPAACIPGVIAGLALIDTHARIVEAKE
jgi:hypothetical protein